MGNNDNSLRQPPSARLMFSRMTGVKQQESLAADDTVLEA